MTEVDNNATKAPESDAQEDAPISDKPSEQPSAPRLSEHCTSDRPTSTGEQPQGEIRKLGGIDTYITKPPTYPSSPSKLLLLLSNGTGLQSRNNQLQADRFAASGFVTILPDLFSNDPAPNTTTSEAETASASASLLDAVKLKAAETAKSFLIDMWLARHSEEKVMPIVTKVVDAARSEFADAVAAGGGVYAVGYCFGGRYVLLLASEQDGEVGSGSAEAEAEQGEGGGGDGEGKKKIGPIIKAGAVAHATLVSPDDFAAIRAPVSLVCVENDPMFPDEVRSMGEDILGKGHVPFEVQVYPGVPHGFAVVGDYNDAHIKDAQVTAHEQILKWLQAY